MSDDDLESTSAAYTFGGAGEFSVQAMPVTLTSFNLSLMPEWAPSEHLSLRMHGKGDVGAIVTKDSRCTKCGKPFEAGHCVTFHLRPEMAGTGHHNDCDDPKLERR